MLRSHWFTWAILLCPASLAAAGEASPKQVVVRTAILTVPDDKPRYHCWEPHLAVDPDDPQRIVVAAMYEGQIGAGENARGDSRLLVWHSADGGRSWSKPLAPFHSSERAAHRLNADPVLAFAKAKTCWLAGNDYDWKIPGQANYSSVKVCLTEDGGKSWNPPLAVAEVDNDKHGKGIVDKPWLAIDRSQGKHRGTLYVAWSRLNEDREHCELRCAALPPGATKFSPSVRLGEPIPFKAGTALIHQVQLAVRPDGTLDAVWRMAPASRLMHAFSRDGSANFSKPMAIAGDDKNGVGQFPSVTAAANGTLCVAWTKDGDVWCSALTSGRWSAPRCVSGARRGGTPLSHPAVAATADALWLMAYRFEGQPRRVAVVLYRSEDNGKSWREDRILASRMLPQGRARPFVPGDYVGLAASKGVVGTAYVLPGEDGKEAKPRLYVSVIDPSTAR